MKRRQLKCFVASAFERDDVDEIFDEVIKPVLRGENMQAMRVDRVEHNDDIDDKILDLIDSCDFAIADLTHARPSVYYEAGRACGLGKPVIYMVRSDHLRPSPDDPAGNVKVHFDLQMKNIIAWTRPVPTLRNRLGARVRHVTRPIIKELERQEVLKIQGMLFNTLSWVDRADDILRRTRAALRRAGFTLVGQVRYSNATGFRVTDKGMDIAAVQIGQSFTKKTLQLFTGDLAASKMMGEARHAAGGNPPGVIACDLLFVTSRPIPSSRVAEVCPTFYHLEPGALYRDPAPPPRPRQATGLHTLCPKSYEDLDHLLDTHIAELGHRGI